MKIFAMAPPTNREEACRNSVKAFGVLGSPQYPTDPAQVAERTGRAYDRSFDPLGSARVRSGPLGAARVRAPSGRGARLGRSHPYASSMFRPS